MKLGLQVIQFDWPGSPENVGATVAEIAGVVDEVGFDSLWTMDHFFQLDAPQMGLAPEQPAFDGYTMLTYMAAVTQRLRLGVLVTGVTYRHPGHLIKIVTGLDVLSGGRAIFGIGAGWYEREAVGLGFPFPPLAERFERLEEALQIAKQMWSDDASPYRGVHYQLAEPINHPQPISRPHPPILIGGAGEKKTLRMVAQYGDACNLFAFNGVEEIVHKLDVLKRHCEDLGRDYDEIERTALDRVDLGPGGMSPNDLIHHCKELADAGIQHLIFTLSDVHTIKPLEVIGREVIPAVAGL